MENQVGTTQNSYMSTLKDQVVMADKVVTKAMALTVEAQQMQKTAKKERDSANAIKNNGKALKIASPFIALILVWQMYFILDILGMPTPSKVVGIILIAIICVAICLIPFKPQKHIAKAEECEKKAQENFNAVGEIIKKYSDCLAVIPQKYWYPLATGYIAEVISNGRATTIPIALDKLEEQIHRWNMERSMQQQVSLQIAQRESLRRIQTNTAVSAVANVVELFR